MIHPGPHGLINMCIYVCVYTLTYIYTCAKRSCPKRRIHGIFLLSFLSAGLGPRGVDEAQAALPKNRLHHLWSLMYICRKEELSVRGVFALQPQVRKEVVHSKMAGVVLKHRIGHRATGHANFSSIQQSYMLKLNPSTACHSQSNGLKKGKAYAQNCTDT